MSNKYITTQSTSGSGLDKKTSTTYSIKSSDGSSRSITQVSKSKRESVSQGLSIFALIVAIMLLASIISSLTIFDRTITFSSLLYYLQDAPSISHVFSSFEIIPQITSDAGIFNFLIPMLNASITIINVLVLVFRLVANSIDFIFYLIGFFFAF